jgi:glutamate-ammonia-ligase adenylyltransferase
MENSSSHNTPPKPFQSKEVELGLQKWAEVTAHCEDATLAQWMQDVANPTHTSYPLMAALLGNCPYLSRLLLQYPNVFFEMVTTNVDQAWKTLLLQLDAIPPEAADYSELMRHLRQCKGKAALLIALADLAGWWALPQVTQALSELAQRSLMLSVDAILATAHKRGEIELPHPENPSQGSGIIVLGMGKLGGRELNYSSDIDLIILFEPNQIGFKGRISEQKFMTRLSHDIVTLMQERTPHGYVFRTDLRLRPDPASTPPAINTEAAYYYYESVGQNWERAAMIKARPVAGDMVAGERFLKGLTPFMWRRNLDFAAITDIHSIKRQMDSHRNKQIQLKGHNIKLGQGGIREIEFFAQIHQLIWGGREPVLRTRATCDTLVKLSEYGLIDAAKEQLLQNAYVYFRKLEHRLQMVDDAQTHSIPDDAQGIAHIACFMGYDSSQDFHNELMPLLSAVHEIYASSFKGDHDSELGDEGNLVFTGVSHDPDTLETLTKMGYVHPETVSEIVMGWHHGSRRATRTKRARELLTEMMPLLLKRLSETANPDVAFLKFNEFLANLPSGVQLFSLFNANPQLLGLIADIMGSAPTLADSLSKSPELLDAVLYDDFYAALPSPTTLAKQLNDYLDDHMDVETHIERIRYFRDEKQFQAGVQLLRGMITAQTASTFLSHIADVTIQKSFAIIFDQFVKTYGAIADSHFAVIALGKLGSFEMTFSSDIDLVFVYEAPDFDKFSDGE